MVMELGNANFLREPSGCSLTAPQMEEEDAPQMEEEDAPQMEGEDAQVVTSCLLSRM